ncbi:MAG: glutamate synthase central domain-containing protein, partial [Pseudomonadota bacterium]
MTNAKLTSKTVVSTNRLSQPGFPGKQGLYDPRNEKDACGVGFIANLKGVASHSIIQDGLQILQNLEHRGAVGADPKMGDGAGMLVQIPHDLFKSECAGAGFQLPAKGQYGVAQVFLPQDPQLVLEIETMFFKGLEKEGLELIGQRTLEVDNSALSTDPEIAKTEPLHRQYFVACPSDMESGDAFERKLYTVRKVISNMIFKYTEGRDNGYYIVSFSSRTIVYKGMFLADQLGPYYKDLTNPEFKSALALVHQRFSTNTFPSWKLSHPYRMVAHNGEINTLRGNVNWMAARQASVSSPLFGENITKLWPISYEGQSDTACFDNALEFLTMGGYSLAHAVMMLIPEAWSGNPLMDEERRAFYEYHAALMEPWDGPAAVAFTDGRQIGATLDRNGLRPARYIVTKDDRIIMSSESGVLPVEQKDIAEKWRLQPGRMLLIDLERGEIISDEEIKRELANQYPYQKWLDRSQIMLEEMPIPTRHSPQGRATLLDRQQAFGYTQEDLKLLMAPMATTGQEAVGSMGTDTPISALSSKPKLLYTYFKQLFAQVTNPPIDPIREESVMSLVSLIGPRPNLFDIEGLSEKKRLEVRQPILANNDLEKVREIGDIGDNQFNTQTLDITYNVERGPEAMAAALDSLCDRAEKSVNNGYNIIVLSDRQISAQRVAIPALLATAAVHRHLIRKGLRTSVGLVLESGEPREIHHFCVLAGYGAEAINPYLAFETLADMHAKGELPEEVDTTEIVQRYIKAINKGMLKVMSKMGISTYQSYCGAQIFDAVGLSSELVDEFFFGTATMIEGVGLDEIAIETLERHKKAFSNDLVLSHALDIGGEYAYRMRGESHAWTPDNIAKLQHAVRGNSAGDYEEFAEDANQASEEFSTIRGLFKLKSAEEIGRKPVDISEVEPAAEIVKRFSTGAMSFGSISREAHTTLAVAMNQIGGKSNTGEGGEE